MHGGLDQDGLEAGDANGGVRIFEAVAGHGGRHQRTIGDLAGTNGLDQAGQWGGTRGLDHHTLGAGQELVGVENFFVGDRADGA